MNTSKCKATTVLTGEDFPPLSWHSNKTFNPKFLSIVVHELEPKKNGYLVPVGKQNIIQLQRVDFQEKCDELSEWVAFGQKLSYFTDQKRPTGGPHENGF